MAYKKKRPLRNFNDLPKPFSNQLNKILVMTLLKKEKRKY
jgi:hypothetical protein